MLFSLDINKAEITHATTQFRKPDFQLVALPLGLSLISFCVNILHDNSGCTQNSTETLSKKGKKVSKGHSKAIPSDSPAMGAAALGPGGVGDLSSLNSWD